MAEVIARQLLADRPGLEFASAGVFAAPGAPASPEAVEAMAKKGLALGQHRSQPLTPKLIEDADGIYTMTASHRQAVVSAFPTAEVKTQRLHPDFDIEDPIGGPLESYQRTAEQIEQGLRTRFTEESA